jgi:hypothetical protein
LAMPHNVAHQLLMMIEHMMISIRSGDHAGCVCRCRNLGFQTVK